MNDGGWLKLYWKLKDNPVYDNSSTLAFWVHILLSTARKRHLLRNGQTLEVGQCLISTRSVAEWLQVSDRTVRRYVDFLSAETMVEVLKRDRNGTLISVCNWGTYQNIDCVDVRETQRNDVANATQRRSNSAQTEIPKNPKKGKKGKKNPSGSIPHVHFERWWDSVHIKTGKRAASKEYDAAVRRLEFTLPEDQDPHEFLLNRMQAFAKTPEANTTERTPVHPRTWLCQGRYDDDPATWEKTYSNGKPKREIIPL